MLVVVVDEEMAMLTDLQTLTGLQDAGDRGSITDSKCRLLNFNFNFYFTALVSKLLFLLLVFLSQIQN